MFRISLREIFALVAAVALAIVSLKYASETWVAIIAGLAMLAFFVAIVVAAVDRGPRQAFAIGFVVVVLAYGLIVLNTPNPHDRNAGTLEFDQWAGRLPTTRLLRYVHRSVDRSQWVDLTSGKVVPETDPAVRALTSGGGFGGGGGGGMPAVGFNEIPQRANFMPIGHLWWALLFGYIGGRFARFLYVRRANEDLTP